MGVRLFDWRDADVVPLFSKVQGRDAPHDPAEAFYERHRSLSGDEQGEFGDELRWWVYASMAAMVGECVSSEDGSTRRGHGQLHGRVGRGAVTV